MRQRLALIGLSAVTLGLTACGEPASKPAVRDVRSAPATAPTSPGAASNPTTPTGFSVTTPTPGATTTSPLTVTGVAPNDWYSEAVFEGVLLDAEGNVLAEAPAQAQGDWTRPGLVPFRAVFAYAVDTNQTGTIVLTEDQTGEREDSDDAPVREVRIPVTLTASK